MKKRITVLILVIFYLCAGFGITVYAEEQTSSDEPSITDELGIDVNGITDNLTPEVNEFISEHNLSVDNTDEMTKISPKDVFNYILNQLKEKMLSPLKTLASILAVIIICSVIQSTGDSMANKSYTRIYEIICVIISVQIIVKPLTDCITTTTRTLRDGGAFMLGYIPVFASITASAGNITSAVSYNMLVVLVAEAAVQLASHYIMPALSICMALGIVEAVNPNFNLSGITNAIKKASTFVLGFIMTIFIGLLSIQSVVGASADTLGIKAAKFMASNFIPVIGGAVADAYTTVKSSLGLLRGGVGFFGIAALFIMMLPPILEVLGMWLTFSAGNIIAEMFGVNQLKILLKNSSSVLSLAFSLLICFSVMLIISTTIIMMIGLTVS